MPPEAAQLLEEPAQADPALQQVRDPALVAVKAGLDRHVGEAAVTAEQPAEDVGTAAAGARRRRRARPARGQSSRDLRALVGSAQQLGAVEALALDPLEGGSVGVGDDRPARPRCAPRASARDARRWRSFARRSRCAWRARPRSPGMRAIPRMTRHGRPRRARRGTRREGARPPRRGRARRPRPGAAVPPTSRSRRRRRSGDDPSGAWTPSTSRSRGRRERSGRSGPRGKSGQGLAAAAIVKQLISTRAGFPSSSARAAEKRVEEVARGAGDVVAHGRLELGDRRLQRARGW